MDSLTAEQATLDRVVMLPPRRGAETRCHLAGQRRPAGQTSGSRESVRAGARDTKTSETRSDPHRRARAREARFCGCAAGGSEAREARETRHAIARPPILARAPPGCVAVMHSSSDREADLDLW